LIRKLYDWVLRQAEKPYAEWILFALAMAEASVFPLPPDILLLPMAVARRDRAWRFAAVCTLGSVLGGLIGYGIGALAMATIGQKLVNFYHWQNALENFQNWFDKWGLWVVVIQGFLPIIPFKLVTITSGIAKLNLVSFVLAAIVTRGTRFYIVAILGYNFGEQIKAFIEKHLTWVALGILAAIITGFWLVLR